MSHLENRRFLGAWELVSFESLRPDGTVTRPWGDDPFGLVLWTDSGHMSAQLGPRNQAARPYLAYCGTIEAADVSEGTLVHRVVGASRPALLADQVRSFSFPAEDSLVLSPPAAPDGSQSVLRWRRLIAVQDRSTLRQ